MIENLLIDPEVIWKAIVTVRHKTNFTSPSDIESALNSLLDEMKEHECTRRVKAAVGPKTFRLQDPVGEAEAQLDAHIAELRSRLNTERLAQDYAEAEAQVVLLTDRQRRREYFDGKRILSEFYRRHMHDTGMSREIFTYELALQAGARESVQKFVGELFDTLGAISEVSD